MVVPAGALICAVGATGLGGGALYTGRGPVCGTIMRGAGGCGGTATASGATGRGAAAGGCGAVDAVTEGVGGPTAAGGGGTPGGRAGGAATVACGGGGAAGGGVAFTAGGTATGLAATGGAAGRVGAAAASFFCVMAFSTSPGREMCDKSILVLISSSPRSVRADRADSDCASDEPRMWARTFSASCSSSELEWVFFSVTPTIGRASRMVLLLTSSSLARSLIRTLLIRPFLYPALRLSLHCILTESASCTRTPSQMCARAITIQFFRERSHLSALALRFRLGRLRLPPSPQEPPLLLPRPLRRMPLQRQLPARLLHLQHHPLRSRLPSGLPLRRRPQPRPQINYSPRDCFFPPF